jgi:phage-related protein
MAVTYSIFFYNASVEADIAGWPAGINASFTRIAEQMVETGPNLGLPYTRPFGDGLFEIRAKGAEGIGRAFFCSLTGRKIVILHGFIKKTQQTPAKDLKTARKRLKEIQRG